MSGTAKPTRGTRKALGLEPGTEIVFFGRGDEPAEEGYRARLEVNQYRELVIVDLEGDRHPRSFGAAGKFWAAPVSVEGPAEESDDQERATFQIRYPYARIVESAGLPGTPEPGWMSQCRHPECPGHRKAGLATEQDARDAYASHLCSATEPTCTAEAGMTHVFDGRPVAPEVESEWELCGKPVGDDVHDVEIQPRDIVRRLRVDTMTPTGPELEVVRVSEVDDDPVMIQVYWPEAPSDDRDCGLRWVSADTYRVVRRPEKPQEEPKRTWPDMECPECLAPAGRPCLAPYLGDGELDEPHELRLRAAQERQMAGVGTPEPLGPMPVPQDELERTLKELGRSIQEAARKVWAGATGTATMPFQQCANTRAGVRCRLEDGHDGAHRSGDLVPVSWEGEEPHATCVLGAECAEDDDQVQVALEPHPGVPLELATFFVPGKPRPKGSLRPELYRGKGGALKVRMVEQVEEGPRWRKRAAKAAQVAAFGADATKIPAGWPSVLPVEVRVMFVFDRRTASGTSGLDEPTDSSRFGDLDKLQRNLGDALKDAHLIADDGQIAHWDATKRFANDGEPEGAYVTVMEWV